MAAIILLLMCFWLSAVPVQAQSGLPQRGDTGRLSASEKWILQKIAAGEVADLKEQFGEDEKARQVRASF